MKKLDEITKVKLIYSGELAFFAILFLVLGILQAVNVINISERFLNIFKFLTLAGAAYITFDFVRCVVNKTKRAKTCWIDKFSTIYIPPYLIVIDILLLSKNEFVWNNPKYFITPLFFVFSIVYLFQGIYHWFKPLPELLEEIEEEKKEENKPTETVENVEEQKSEETVENTNQENKE